MLIEYVLSGTVSHRTSLHQFVISIDLLRDLLSFRQLSLYCYRFFLNAVLKPTLLSDYSTMYLFLCIMYLHRAYTGKHTITILREISV